MPLTPHGNLNTFRNALNTGEYQDVPDGLMGTHKPTEYRTIVETWFDEMKNTIWPIWSNALSWEGRDEAEAEQATREEVELCLVHFMRANKLDAFPDHIQPSVPVSERRTHRIHYRIEDAFEVKPWELGPKELFHPTEKLVYDFSISRRRPSYNIKAMTREVDADEFARHFWEDAGKRIPKIVVMKTQFQRPRPWAVAAYFGFHDFIWERAEVFTHTGNHPAFPSGHCWQGVINTGAVYSHYLQTKSHTSPELAVGTIDALMQYAVDWGDRRVFAGVHYPTDNIASWVLAKRLAPKLFPNGDEVAEFIRQAVVTKSDVYRLIEGHYATDALSPARDYLMNEFAGVGV